jgi:hypothetical protein
LEKIDEQNRQRKSKKQEKKCENKIMVIWKLHIIPFGKEKSDSQE